MKQRIITGVIAGALFLTVLFLGGKLFLALTAILAIIGVSELLKMRKRSWKSISGVVSFLLAIVLVLPYSFTETIGSTGFTKWSVVYVSVIILLSLTVLSNNKFNFEDACFHTLTPLYVGVSFYYFNETRDMGISYVLFILFMIWASDSGAYFFGRKIGKRKLWPEISPNKTIEGFGGGILCSIVVAIFFAVFSDMPYSVWQYIVIAIVTATLGTFGDLVQSAYKRHYGVKDSGDLLPGHGGVLDRFDSLMFVLPILHIFNLL